MLRNLVLIPWVLVLLSCGFFSDAGPTDPSHGETTNIPSQATTSVVEPTPVTPGGVSVSPVAKPSSPPLPPPTGSPGGLTAPSPSGSVPETPHVGYASIEELIIESNTIVRATMTSSSSEVTVVTDDFYDGGPNNRHSAMFKFNLEVSEYLKGEGPTSTVAVWLDGGSYETNAEASSALDRVRADRDPQWDDRGAIIFLRRTSRTGYGTALDALYSRNDHFILSYGDRYSNDDRYSLHSNLYKAWLPSTATSTATSDDQEFLLDAPPSTETITLGAVKKRIKEITAELTGDHVTPEYEDCVFRKYRFIRDQRFWPEVRGRPLSVWTIEHNTGSGMPVGTELDRFTGSDDYPDQDRLRIWLEGEDADLFTAENGTSTPVDTDGDGDFDEVEFDKTVKTTRPLIAGVYSFSTEENSLFFATCGFDISNEWTVTVPSPEDTLHELFFDPVTVGSTVAANSTNGVLKPTTFTGADGAPSTIDGIVWEPSATSSGSASGSVEVEVVASDLNAALDEHLLDFIGLDGTVSLSLDVFDAIVRSQPVSGTGTQTHTLTWSLSSQPWTAGDKLMVRIREAPPSCRSGSVIPDARTSPGLVGDCVEETAGEPVEPPVSATTQAVDETTVPAVMSVAPPIPFWTGDSLIGLKIIYSDTVVRATLASFSSEVVAISGPFYGTDVSYSPILKFNLSVSEYLKGTGSTSTVAIWMDGDSYGTRDEANDRLARILANRDAQWDDREAIIFMIGAPRISFGTVLDELFDRDDHFFLSRSDPDLLDDMYTLHSETLRKWLPANTTVTATGDGQEFLLDVPPTTKTVTLGTVRQRISEIAAEVAAGDGSEAYRNCLIGKYEDLTNQRNWPEERGRPYTSWKISHEIASGLPVGTLLTKLEVETRYPDSGKRLDWQLAGGDVALFISEDSAARDHDRDGDGEPDEVTYDMTVKLARPLIAGEYRFDHEHSWPYFKLCNYVEVNPWTVTVTAPDGTLHELFFDPVGVGTTVAANSTNGVLKPASFTGADGAASTISALAWEPSATSSGSASGSVRVEVVASDLNAALDEHLLDFIEMDGSVSLSLDVFDATVESQPASGTGTQTHTLNWTVSRQPWESGDRLMVRIREAPP